MDSNRIKAVIDLFDHVKAISTDRPPVGAMLKELNIAPITMQDAVNQTAMATSIAIPPAAFALCNELFKLGVTIGYKYAVKKGMEHAFSMNPDDDPEEDVN